MSYKNLPGKFARLACVLSAFLSINCSISYSQTYNTKVLDSFLRASESRGITQGVVLLSRHNKVIYKKAFGYANSQTNTKNDPDTKFRLASLSKTITSIAIMQLVQNNKLKVTDRISDILDWYPRPMGNFVSIQNLLTMNSGIPSYTNNYDFLNIVSRSNSFSVQSFVLSYCYPAALLFQPGCDSVFNYSNSNYYILGAVIEKLSGKTYADYVTENIFKPLGMSNSGYYSNTATYTNMSSAYTVMPATTVAEYMDNTCAYSTGGLYSTVGDLFKLDQALYSNVILSQPNVQEIFKNRYPAQQANEWMYGWQFLLPTTTAYVYKTGVLPGIRTLFIRGLADSSTVIMLNNNDNNNSTGENMIINMLTFLATGNISKSAPIQQDISIPMVSKYNKQGVDSAIAFFNKINGSAAAANYELSDAELLTVGQYLTQQNDFTGANKIFALLTATYPASIYATYKAK